MGHNSSSRGHTHQSNQSLNGKGFDITAQGANVMGIALRQ
jgi:hypothetical protein